MPWKSIALAPSELCIVNIIQTSSTFSTIKIQASSQASNGCYIDFHFKLEKDTKVVGIVVKDYLTTASDGKNYNVVFIV